MSIRFIKLDLRRGFHNRNRIWMKIAKILIIEDNMGMRIDIFMACPLLTYYFPGLSSPLYIP